VELFYINIELKEVVLDQVLMIVIIKKKIKIIKMIMIKIKLMIKLMTKLIMKIINLIKNKTIIINQNYKASWMLPFLLSKLGLEESGSSNLDISYGVFLLSLIALICFINVLGFSGAHIFLFRKRIMKQNILSLRKLLIIIKILVYFMLF
jgi:hypothetical protein